MIEINGVSKRFDGFAALDGASVTVPAGSVYGLVGPNGAGKSTLIRCLTGIYRPDGGTVSVAGEDVWENDGLKARVGVIPDDWYYFSQSTIRDMCRFYRGLYPGFSMERYERLKEVFAIDERRAIRRLSKGMQKQAAFWLVLSCMPDYLVLDEPVDGLDPVMRRQVWSLVMGDVSQRGTTVLVSSHNLRELEDVCDHVGILDHGKAGAVPGPIAGQHGEAPGRLQGRRRSSRGPGGPSRLRRGAHSHPHHAHERGGGHAPPGSLRAYAGGRRAADAGGNFHL